MNAITNLNSVPEHSLDLDLLRLIAADSGQSVGTVAAVLTSTEALRKRALNMTSVSAALPRTTAEVVRLTPDAVAPSPAPAQPAAPAQFAPEPKTFGEWLRVARDNMTSSDGTRGMSQNEFAKLLQLPNQVTVSTIENGTKVVPFSQWGHFEKVIGLCVPQSIRNNEIVLRGQRLINALTLSHAAAARAMGLTVSELRDWLCGRSEPKLAAFLALASSYPVRRGLYRALC